MTKKIIFICSLFALCTCVKDCLDKAEKAFVIPASQMYLQAAQVYAIQELAQTRSPKQ